MPRLVRHDRTGPYKIEIEGKPPIWICGCGLSKNKPYCDSSHKKTKDEEPGALYLYDEAQNRVRVPTEY